MSTVFSVSFVYPEIIEVTKEEDKETCYSQMHVVAISIGKCLQRLEL